MNEHCRSRPVSVVVWTERGAATSIDKHVLSGPGDGFTEIESLVDISESMVKSGFGFVHETMQERRYLTARDRRVDTKPGFGRFGSLRATGGDTCFFGPTNGLIRKMARRDVAEKYRPW